jgi:hypothetical protein
VSVLEPLLFNIFIHDLCDVINHSNYLLFADDPKSVGLLIHLLIVCCYSHVLILSTNCVRYIL